MTTPVKKMTYEELEAAYITLQQRLQISEEMNEYRHAVIVYFEEKLAQATAAK